MSRSIGESRLKNENKIKTGQKKYWHWQASLDYITAVTAILHRITVILKGIWRRLYVRWLIYRCRVTGRCIWSVLNSETPENGSKQWNKTIFMLLFFSKNSEVGQAMGNETFYREGPRTFQPTRENKKKLNKSKQYHIETSISSHLLVRPWHMQESAG